MTRPDGVAGDGVGRGRALLYRLPAVTWLAIVWVALWGDLTIANLLIGVLLAFLVTSMFPFPVVTRHISFRPLWALAFILRLLWDLFPATLQVASHALRPGRLPRSAVIAIPLHDKADLLMTITAGALSLVPGTSIVELDREAGIMYIHALGVENKADVELVRQDVLALEQRVLRAFGPKVAS